MPAMTKVPTSSGEFDAYEATPPGVARGGLTVLPTIRGLNDHLQEVCRRFADEGYHVIAPNLHHRVRENPLGYDEDFMPVLSALTGEGLISDVDDSIGWLRARGHEVANVGIVGFALGGGVALYAATRRAIGAAVSAYGTIDASVNFGLPALSEPALETPWLGLFAESDPGTPVAEVEVIRRHVAGAEHPAEVVLYEGTMHGFMQDDRADLYDEAAAQDAWRRMLDWLGRYVVNGAAES